jgi:hypothetical protein
MTRPQGCNLFCYKRRGLVYTQLHFPICCSEIQVRNVYETCRTLYHIFYKHPIERYTKCILRLEQFW